MRNGRRRLVRRSQKRRAERRPARAVLTRRLGDGHDRRLRLEWPQRQPIAGREGVGVRVHSAEHDAACDDGGSPVDAARDAPLAGAAERAAVEAAR
eukprot:1876738-Prymnesium_polylepis.1